MNPPEFHGDMDSLKTHDWLTSNDRTFEFTPFSKEDKDVCATQMVMGLETRWWMSVFNMMTSLGISNTWEYFKVAMLDKYFPNSIRTQKDIEFQ